MSGIFWVQTFAIHVQPLSMREMSLGELHVHDGLTFGRALADAEAIERKVALDPLIVLSSDVCASAKAALGF